MPRPKKEGSGLVEPKKRSRTGCWPCKARKVKCGEEKPNCTNCVKTGEACDYSIKLNWGGRSKRDKDGTPTEPGSFTFVTSPGTGASHAKSNSNGREHVFSAQHIATAPPRRPISREASSLSSADTTPGGEAPALDPQLHPTQYQSYQQERRAPALGGLPHLPPLNGMFQQSPGSAERSPPTSAPLGEEFRWSPQHSAKRVKLSPSRSTPHPQPSPVFAVPQYPAQLEQSPASTHFTPHSISSIVNTPATPGSSIHSGSSPYPPPPATLHVQDPPDLRRLSVKSLLSDPSEESERERPQVVRAESSGYRTYGYDHGLHDLDIPHNDDNRVVLPKSPDMRRASAAVSEVSTTSSGDIDAKLIAFEPGGYYAQPVPIRIPRFLEPLPEELLGNQMNLLYFHHFINHTGRIMVPHDCPENPFRGVLPQMAVRNTHLLHLVLAFSASHRARLLDHPEPANRIADWMSDVLPALRQALSDDPTTPGTTDPRDPSSLAPLATAIMLASLEIVSPNTFAVPIPWQHHLQIARQIIVAKGGLHHLAQQADGARDKAIFFLSRWFAYLDVLGSLSGSKQDQPLFGAYLEDGGGRWLVNRSDDEIYQIDCFFGFSGRCIALLAQVAQLAGECDRLRIDPVTNEARPGWLPEQRVRQQAVELQRRLGASATTVYRGCTHTDPQSPQHSVAENKSEQDVAEIFATNEAYHWAGLIHLSRRVLGLPASHPQVQDSVRKVVACLEKVRRGSTAESCLLFPMFSAGCEAVTAEDRGVFMARLMAVEGWGMQHVGRARVLMQRVWDTGRGWETLVDGEFFG
ncbi:hypothetical protein LTR85_002042 [Meristemomyces frigidus]|nr:hypothetical protein LTR85_002042 [Meristemomyces frigidus]